MNEKLKALAMSTPVGRAIFAARERTGCHDAKSPQGQLGVTVAAGRSQLVLVRCTAGKTTVKPLTDWMPHGAAVAALETINP